MEWQNLSCLIFLLQNMILKKKRNHHDISLLNHTIFLFIGISCAICSKFCFCVADEDGSFDAVGKMISDFSCKNEALDAIAFSDTMSFN